MSIGKRTPADGAGSDNAHMHREPILRCAHRGRTQPHCSGAGSPAHHVDESRRAGAHIGPCPSYPTRLITVPDWNKYHPWPTQAGLRHLIFHAESNGFRDVTRRIGRRVLIDERAFFAWADHMGRNP